MPGSESYKAERTRRGQNWLTGTARNAPRTPTHGKACTPKWSSGGTAPSLIAELCRVCSVSCLILRVHAPAIKYPRWRQFDFVVVGLRLRGRRQILFVLFPAWFCRTALQQSVKAGLMRAQCIEELSLACDYVQNPDRQSRVCPSHVAMLGI